MTFQPAFYDNFKCKADRCRHSCCKGWEIDVDEDTAFYYRQMEDDFGKKIAASMYEDEEGSHFRLMDERCPHLRGDGLCEIILRLGEEALCDICDLHPRFFFDVGEYEFAGLGACCEAVCDLLLDEEEELFFLDEEGSEYKLSDIIKMLFPDAGDVPGYVYDTTREKADYVIDIFSKTEPIDDKWKEELAGLSGSEGIPELSSPDIRKLQKIYDYILYRQLELISGKGLKAVADYAALSTDFIALHYMLSGDIKESLRRFSEQIEYSTENVDILI